MGGVDAQPASASITSKAKKDSVRIFLSQIA
jgi:hypothetical protein